MLETPKTFSCLLCENRKDKMDNQQIRPFNLGWLVAAIESEGHFSFVRQKKKKYINYYPLITIANADDLYIDACDAILTEHGIPHYNEARRFRGTSKGIRAVKICGYKRCKKLLDLVVPWLKTKRKRARLLLGIIDYRLSLPAVNAPYSEKEELAYRDMRTLNGNLRDYTPNTNLVKI